MNVKRKSVYIILGIMLLSIWSFLYLYLYEQTHPGVTGEKLLRGENSFRVTDLNEVYKGVLKYIELTGQNPHSLFTVFSYMYSKNKVFPFSIYVYGDNLRTYEGEALKSETKFNSLAQYKLVQVDTKENWGIIELKPGQLGKYVFLITQTGAIYRILTEENFIRTIKAREYPIIPLIFLRQNFQADQRFSILHPEGELKRMNYDHQVITINRD